MSLDKLGQDEWVANVEKRRRAQHPAVAAVIDTWNKMPRAVQFLLLIALPATFPILTRNNYLISVGGLVWLYATLAVGLNTVVGYVGLLDLGYVAFFGMGAYLYSLLSSPQLGIHVPSVVSIPLVIVTLVGMGFLLGLPSLRLSGDYLAIVTLGFGQIFFQLVNTLPVTGGPNGVSKVDPLHLFSLQADSVTANYYLLLASLVVVLFVIWQIHQSRLGRAWRAIREDNLAAEAMGIPTDRLKLVAFAVGAGIAGACGGIFAAWQKGAFPSNFDISLLISLYAMVVLGGVGSLRGMVSGAFVLTVLQEILQQGQSISLPFPQLQFTPAIFFFAGILVVLIVLIRRQRSTPLVLAALVTVGLMIGAFILAIAQSGENIVSLTIKFAPTIFYGGTLIMLLLLIKPRRRLIPVLIRVILGGLILRFVVGVIAPNSLIDADPNGGLVNLIRQWLVIPARVKDATMLGNLAFFVVVGLLILLTRLPKGPVWLQPVLLAVTLYLLIFVWETRLSQEASTTRLLLIGAMLVLLMTYRPQGLFGARRVEIV